MEICEVFHTIYQITNLINGKIYVGAHSTNNLNDSYMGSSASLKASMIKHGRENFKKEILIKAHSREDMFLHEKRIVDDNFIGRKDTYNFKLGGLVPPKYACVLGGAATKGLIGVRKGSDYKKVRPELVQSFLNDGWRLRKRYVSKSLKKDKSLKRSSKPPKGSSRIGTVYVFNSELKKSIQVHKENLHSYIESGWKRGRKIIFIEEDRERYNKYSKK